MKKTIAFLTALLLLVAGVFAGNSRAAIDEFFEDYEEFVEAYEEVAEENDLMAMLELTELMEDMSDSCEEIQNFGGWTAKDSKRLLELETRLAKAIEKLSGTSATPTMGGYDLGAFGF